MHVLKRLEELTEKELLGITDQGHMSIKELDTAMKGVCLLTEIEKLKKIAIENGSMDPTIIDSNKAY